MGNPLPANSVDRECQLPCQVPVSRCPGQVRVDRAPRWRRSQTVPRLCSQLPYGNSEPRFGGHVPLAAEESPTSTDVATGNGKQLFVVSFAPGQAGATG